MSFKKNLLVALVLILFSLIACNPVNKTQPKEEIPSQNQPKDPGDTPKDPGDTPKDPGDTPKDPGDTPKDPEDIPKEDAGDGQLRIEIINLNEIDVIQPNQQLQLEVSTFLNDNQINDSSHNLSFDYESLNEDILTVNSNGVITSKKQGIGTIAVHATATDDKGKSYSSNIINVTISSLDVNDPTNHMHYERFVERSLEQAILDININKRQDSGEGAIWMVGVTSVERGGKINIDNRYYGRGTNNMLMNWFNGSIVLVGNMSAPIPLIVPTYKFKGISYGPDPSDPAVVYSPDVKNAQSITVYYEELLSNTKNENNLGSLYNASTWDRQPGDKVDLVVYIYLMKEDINWYEKKASPKIAGGDGLTVDQIIPLTNLDVVLELQRFPVILE